MRCDHDVRHQKIEFLNLIPLTRQQKHKFWSILWSTVDLLGNLGDVLHSVKQTRV